MFPLPLIVLWFSISIYQFNMQLIFLDQIIRCVSVLLVSRWIVTYTCWAAKEGADSLRPGKIHKKRVQWWAAPCVSYSTTKFKIDQMYSKLGLFFLMAAIFRFYWYLIWNLMLCSSQVKRSSSCKKKRHYIFPGSYCNSGFSITTSRQEFCLSLVNHSE